MHISNNTRKSCFAASHKHIDLLNSCVARYVRLDDPLGTPIFPIPINEVFEINRIKFMVRASTIQGAGLGLFVHNFITRGTSILHYGGDKYFHDDWVKLCMVYPRFSKYSLLEDPKVECLDDMVYIVGDVKHGNVSGYINSILGSNITPNVQYTLVPELPPWCTSRNSVEHGYICIESLRDIHVNEELFADYEFL